MSDIRNELLAIISSLNGSASIDEIASVYAKCHKMPTALASKSGILSTLKSCDSYLRFNLANGKFESLPKANEKMLYVSDNRYFSTIREAMSKIFNKSVSSGGAYFSVDEQHSAWFPQFGNASWDNTYTDDGKFWFEKSKDADADNVPDNKIRYAFVHEKEGYRFTGVFKLNKVHPDKTREYEIIDDKVKIRRPLVVCRVAYMKYYNGITAEDTPVNGGSYVAENNDAFEKNNFHRHEDGNCYGFIETKYRSGHTGENDYANAIAIESINPMCKDQSSVDGVRVVLMAFSPTLRKNVVVGWYDNATVYRERVVEDDLIYMMKCQYSDAHLIPEAERSFEIPRAQSNSFGIGQSNFWYIQTKENAFAFEQKLTDYIDNAY